MAKENNQGDPQGQSPNNQQDPSGQGGQSSGQQPNNQQNQNVDNLPDKFKGKNASEIAQQYLELEKTYGKHTKEVDEVRGQLQQWEKLGKILESNPELYKQVESEIARYSGKKTDTTENDQVSEEIKDTKLALESRTINDFEQKYNLNRLPPEKKADLLKRVGQEIAEMLDPGGKKPVKQVLDTIPQSKLAMYLEKGYKLATINDTEEQSRAKAIIEARQNQEASFGSMASGSLPTQKIQLTAKEKEVAQKMGISEENYLKNKIAIAEGK